MSSTRIYIGNLHYEVRERDVEDFFRGYGKINDIQLKRGYGFVDFDDIRDAEDAVYDLDGKKMCNRPITVEKTKGKPRGRDRYADQGGRKFGGRPPPMRTKYRVLVENLSSRVSWQDLKDFVSKVVTPTFADAHKKFKNEGIIEFASYEDMKRAISKLDKTDLNGRTVRLIEDTGAKGSRRRSSSRSRSPDQRRADSRADSRSSRSPVSKREGNGRQRSPYDRRSRSRSTSVKRSQSPYDRRSRSRSTSVKRPLSPYDRRSRSRSTSAKRPQSPYDRRSPRNDADRSRSRSPRYDDQARGRSRSGSKKSRSRSRSAGDSKRFKQDSE